MIKLLACAGLFFAMVISVNIALASNFDYGNISGGQIIEAIEKTTPVHFLPPNPVYYLVRIKEIVSRFFTPSARERAQFDFVIASKRLKEGYLLLRKGDSSRAGSSLFSYVDSLVSTKSQLIKAKNQNQDIMPDINQMADGLQYQEIILASVSGKVNDLAYTSAAEGFGDFVKYLDTLKPGLLGRYRIINVEGNSQQQIEVLPSPTPVLKFESTASSSPRRIIY